MFAHAHKNCRLAHATTPAGLICDGGTGGRVGKLAGTFTCVGHLIM